MRSWGRGRPIEPRSDKGRGSWGVLLSGAGLENSCSLLLPIADNSQIAVHNTAMANVMDSNNLFLNLNLVDYSIITNSKAI
jgi:hypothetical protein